LGVPRAIDPKIVIAERDGQRAVGYDDAEGVAGHIQELAPHG